MKQRRYMACTFNRDTGMFDVVATWHVKNESLRLKQIGAVMIVLVALILLSLAHFCFGWLSSGGYYVALGILVVIVTALMVVEESLERLRTQKRQPQRDTFCCLHCAGHKPANERSATISGMCLVCADLYEAVQDEV